MTLYDITAYMILLAGDHLIKSKLNVLFGKQEYYSAFIDPSEMSSKHGSICCGHHSTENNGQPDIKNGRLKKI
jgi:hypothetical protein